MNLVRRILGKNSGAGIPGAILIPAAGRVANGYSHDNWQGYAFQVGGQWWLTFRIRLIGPNISGNVFSHYLYQDYFEVKKGIRTGLAAWWESGQSNVVSVAFSNEVSGSDPCNKFTIYNQGSVNFASNAIGINGTVALACAPKII